MWRKSEGERLFLWMEDGSGGFQAHQAHQAHHHEVTSPQFTLNPSSGSISGKNVMNVFGSGSLREAEDGEI